MVMALLRAIVFLIMLFSLGIAAMLIPAIVEPVSEIAMDSTAAESAGFTAGLDLAITIGLVIIIPSLVLVGIIWLHVGPLQQDVHQRRIR